MISNYRAIADLDALHQEQHRILFQNSLGMVEKVATAVPTINTLPVGYMQFANIGGVKSLYFNLNNTIVTADQPAKDYADTAIAAEWPLTTAKGGTGSAANANAANGVVILNSSGYLPALNGSLLTGLAADMSYANTRFKVGYFTKNTADGAGTQAITGVGFQPKAIVFMAGGGLGGVALDAGGKSHPYAQSWGVDDGTNASCMYYWHDSNGVVASGHTSRSIVLGYNNSTMDAYITTLGADGFTITWTAGINRGTASIQVVAFR